MTYPATLDTYTTVNDGDTILKGMFNDPNDGIEKLMIEVGIDGTAAESVKYKVDNFFVAASHVFFAQATPPTGWTTDTAHKDNVLACKADSGVYSVIGADKGDFDIVAANIPAHDHGSAGAHTHAFRAYVTGSTVHAVSLSTNRQTSGSEDIAYATTPHVLSDGAHTHTSFGSSDGLYRPKATVGVIATYTGA